MKVNLKPITSTILILMLLCPVIIQAQSKKRKKAPRPKNRQEVVTMGASIGHDVEWKRDPKTGRLIAVSPENPNESYTSPLEAVRGGSSRKRQISPSLRRETISKEPLFMYGGESDKLLFALNCCETGDWKGVQTAFQELKRQMTRGLKVFDYEDSSLGQAIRVGPNDIGLLERYNMRLDEEIIKLPDGSIVTNTHGVDSTYHNFFQINDSHVYWGLGHLPRRNGDPSCLDILKLVRPETYATRCDLGKTVLDVTLQISNGEVRVQQVETSQDDGSNRTHKFSGHFTFAIVRVKPQAALN